MRFLHALFVALLALSAILPRPVTAAVPAPHAAHVHHGASHHDPAHDCNGCATSCIGCAVPDVPLGTVRPAAFVMVEARPAFVAPSPCGHATALDPPPPKAA